MAPLRPTRTQLLNEIKMTSQTNFAIVKRGCPACRGALKIIDPINLRLPVGKRIKIYDNYLAEEFGIEVHPICKKVSKDGFTAYPFIYLSGLVLEPAQKELLVPFLEEFFKEDFLY